VRRINQLLPGAEADGELRLVVQPIVSLADGRIVRGECLLRWRSRELGEVSPAEFIPIAEQSGIIRDIGRYVFRSATTLAGTLAREHLALPLAVNLSAREVILPTLAEDVKAELDRSGVDPSLLTVELTETAVIGRFDLAQRQLEAVRALGVRVALDDFGTGYSALAAVHRLSVDCIKIDHSLVRDLPEPRATAVARAIVRLAESLDCVVVAEGVETAVQAAALVALGCELAQGFYFARPLEIADLRRRLG
jgi:EAL domain-containing protein (putative c-di-GMP-specific phosphodiesterase class I)